MVIVMGLLDRKVEKIQRGDAIRSSNDFLHIHAKFKEAEIKYYRDRANLQKLREGVRMG